MILTSLPKGPPAGHVHLRTGSMVLIASIGDAEAVGTKMRAMKQVIERDR